MVSRVVRVLGLGIVVKVLGLGVCRVFVMRVLWLGMCGETPRVIVVRVLGLGVCDRVLKNNL